MIENNCILLGAIGIVGDFLLVVKDKKKKYIKIQVKATHSSVEINYFLNYVKWYWFLNKNNLRQFQ